MKILKDWIINELPINGEWWSDGANIFIKNAKKMLNAGIEVNQIKVILQELYYAVASEFGN